MTVIQFFEDEYVNHRPEYAHGLRSCVYRPNLFIVVKREPTVEGPPPPPGPPPPLSVCPQPSLPKVERVPSAPPPPPPPEEEKIAPPPVERAESPPPFFAPEPEPEAKPEPEPVKGRNLTEFSRTLPIIVTILGIVIGFSSFWWFALIVIVIFVIFVVILIVTEIGGDDRR